jgi:hypothetical protein
VPSGTIHLLLSVIADKQIVATLNSGLTADANNPQAIMKLSNKIRLLLYAGAGFVTIRPL